FAGLFHIRLTLTCSPKSPGGYTSQLKTADSFQYLRISVILPPRQWELHWIVCGVPPELVPGIICCYRLLERGSVGEQDSVAQQVEVKLSIVSQAVTFNQLRHVLSEVEFLFRDLTSGVTHPLSRHLIGRQSDNSIGD